MRNERTDKAELVVRLVAVVLMLVGAAMLVADAGTAIAFGIVAIGVAITVILHDKHRQGPAH